MVGLSPLNGACSKMELDFQVQFGVCNFPFLRWSLFFLHARRISGTLGRVLILPSQCGKTDDDADE
jgi:hypothetical protein